ncbi:hypothetical protein [Rhodothalassium salexigens]|uniref:hypothetical protein n=1 Tax=Rhodothalassium salexigens TaxID=1086 RepID=UPI00191238E3|nr:hypothetical protein [Rhodothalassium salexigens]
MKTTNFSIEGFWKKRIAQQPIKEKSSRKGWHSHLLGLETFKEAPLTASDKFGEYIDAYKSNLILVSAPGAVGKSTLARQIASETGATYIDLAEAEPVGGDTLSGGLAKSGMYSDWKTGNAVALIDGLDEARLKVTQEAFEAFLSDVVEASMGRQAPTVLFGRSGAIEDAWLHLSDKLPVCVLEIGYYDPETALDFALLHFDIATPSDAHKDIGKEAIKLLLERLREDTSSDGDRFSGYAPVLQAVANRVAGESNRGALVAQIQRGNQPVTLQKIVSSILEREKGKLSQLTFEDPNLVSRLYTPQEQLRRLAAHIHRVSPPELPKMSANDAKTYSNALKTWVPDHPFLDGRTGTASTVFEAVISAAALKLRDTSETALNRAITSVSANPFLSEFYLDSIHDSELPPEHIGVIYASIRSRLSLGDTASLLIEGAEKGDEFELLASEVEITVARSDTNHIRTLNFQSEQAGKIHLGARIEDVEIVAPRATVEIGGAQETVLIAPISIQCEKLRLSTSRLVVENPTSSPQEGVVYLEANEADTKEVAALPILNGQSELSVAWSGSNVFPWTSFTTTPKNSQDPNTNEALRRFRKFVISFRSHSKGSLKRYAAKIEHERMTKGTGRSVLNHMLHCGVVSTDGSMYTLHPDALSEKAGLSYGMCMSRNFPDKAVQFVQEALDET